MSPCHNMRCMNTRNWSKDSLLNGQPEDNAAGQPINFSTPNALKNNALSLQNSVLHARCNSSASNMPSSWTNGQEFGEAWVNVIETEWYDSCVRNILNGMRSTMCVHYSR